MPISVREGECRDYCVGLGIRRGGGIGFELEDFKLRPDQGPEARIRMPLWRPLVLPGYAA